MTGRSAVAPGLLAFACAFLTLAGTSASAVPIRTHRIAAERTSPRLGPVWNRFLAAGPALWSVEHAPRFPSGIHLPAVNGQLVETPFVDYLLWRRSLDTARFDHYHPIVGPRLASLLSSITAASIPTVQSQSLTPPTRISRETITPEPGSFALSLGLLACGVWWRRRWSPPWSIP